MKDDIVLNKMKAFARASSELTTAIFNNLVSDEMTDAFAKNYPFEKSFDEVNLEIWNWVRECDRENK